MLRIIPRRGLLFAGAGALGSIGYFATRHFASEKQALSPGDFQPFEVEAIEKISHNTKKYRFKFDDPNQESGLTVTSCVITKVSDHYELISYIPLG
jgi:hypothetical protein